jgi:uncharacterized delta-60 repeat protein
LILRAFIFLYFLSKAKSQTYMKKNILQLSFIFLFSPLFSFCQAGSLDNSFSSDGKLTTLVGSTSCYGNSIAIQPNGDILVAGNYKRSGNSVINVNDFAVVRYKPDGTLDNSFAGNGKAGIDFGTDEGSNASVALQPDGKIVVAGYTAQDNDVDKEYFAVARLNADGTPDITFATNGKTQINIKGVYGAMALQPDGKIVIGGYILGSPFVLYRFNSNGTVDNTFGTGGEVSINFGYFDGGESTGVHSILVQPDGKIVASGTVSTGSTTGIGVVRVNTNGTRDPLFGSNGQVITTVGSGASQGLASALQPDGKIIVAGFYTAADRSFAAVRYTVNGTLDNSFAGNGKAGISFTYASQANAVTIQQNGEIILAGQATFHTGVDFALARLTTTGAIDNTFGTAGKVTTDFGSSDAANAVAMQQDGKIVAAGTSGNDIAVARYSSGAVIAIAMATVNAKGEKIAVQLSPNPVTSTLLIQGLSSSVSTSLLITDMAGKPVQKDITAGSSNYSMNIGRLTPGTYLLQLTANRDTRTFKFIKAR